MDTSLLTTKFYVPIPSPGLVTRTGLLERLKDSVNYRLILVAAPAGFGKTTLLSEWILQIRAAINVAWISLDEGDNDPRRFWDYFITAINNIEPAVGETALALLHSGQQISFESILTTLLNGLTSVSGDVVLVMDDFHYIQSPAIHNDLTYFLEHVPPGMHLVLSTRADPPLPVSRFRGKGTLLEIGADDLRFSREETASLFIEMGIQSFSDTIVDAMNTKAEGWVAGLKMAALSMRNKEDLDTFVADFTGSQRFVTDYLFEEVLLQQSEEVRTFLLQTSILDRLNSSLCDAVCGRVDSENMLVNLDSSKLFIVPLDDSREWYRYHHLFRDLLLHQLEKVYGDNEVKRLHLRASQWFEKNKFLDDAINHALAAEDWEKAMDLISEPEVQARTVASQAILNWLERIPEDVLLTRTRICMNFVYGLMMTGRYDEAETWLTYLDDIPENDTLLPGKIDAARGAIASFTLDFLRAEEFAKKALSVLPENDPDVGVACGILSGIYFNQLRFLEAEPLVKKHYEIFRQMGYTIHTISPLTMLGFIAFLRGNYHQAVSRYQEVIELAGKYPALGNPISNAYLMIGCVYHHWNDLKKAASYQEKAIEVFQFSDAQGSLNLDSVYLHLAGTRMAMGETEKAMDAMEKADQLIKDSQDPILRARNIASHAAIALSLGDTGSASRWIDALMELEDSIPLDAATHLVDIRKGKDIARKELEDRYDFFKSQDCKTVLIGLRIRQALISDQSDEALEYLSDALTMGKNIGMIRPLVGFGQILAPLLRRAISKNLEPAYARKILDMIIEEENQRKSRQLEMIPSSSTTGILSKRETEILRLIADGLSNQEIADRLFITLSTAKTHIRHVFDKLGVNDRPRAIAKARDLNLI
ncbi:MAG TPA: tetratricopeptide repeat protein [Dehalococcoidia bacterium]|nr:tetratricopeptide repeat protein [Dehalococcoidia bacterium]